MIQQMLSQGLQQGPQAGVAGGGLGGPQMQGSVSPMNASANLMQKIMLMKALQGQHPPQPPAAPPQPPAQPNPALQQMNPPPQPVPGAQNG
jgi:hypothetical protein